MTSVLTSRLLQDLRQDRSAEKRARLAVSLGRAISERALQVAPDQRDDDQRDDDRREAEWQEGRRVGDKRVGETRPRTDPPGGEPAGRGETGEARLRDSGAGRSGSRAGEETLPKHGGASARRPGGWLPLGWQPAEWQIAKDILRILANDSALMVRAALAEQIADLDVVPREVALRLARDQDEAALPILGRSPVLEDEDLLGLIVGSSLPRLLAIAGRNGLSEAVASALVEVDEIDVIERLLANGSADLGIEALGKIVRRVGAIEEVQLSLARRPHLPMEVIERLIVMMSEELRRELVAKQQLNEGDAEELALLCRARALLHAASFGDALEVYQLARAMHRRGRLSRTTMLLALCQGDEVFFACALAVRARLPIENVRVLLEDGRGAGARKLFERAGLDPDLRDLFVLALRAARRHGFGPHGFSAVGDPALSRAVIDTVSKPGSCLPAEEVTIIRRRLAAIGLA